MHGSKVLSRDLGGKSLGLARDLDAKVLVLSRDLEKSLVNKSALFTRFSGQPFLDVTRLARRVSM